MKVGLAQEALAGDNKGRSLVNFAEEQCYVKVWLS